MEQNFEIGIVNEFPGYNSTIDRTNAPAGTLVRGSQNVYRKISGTIANRPGLLRRGSINATLDGIVASFEWLTSLGAWRPLRMRASGTLEVEVQIGSTYTWYALLTGLTKTRLVCDSYWDVSNSVSFLIMCIGTVDLYSWSGGVSTSAAAVLGATTLKKQNVSTTWQQDGFNQSGSILINGASYTYTSISMDGLTLQGVASLPALPAGTVVIQAVATQANTPTSGTSFTNDFIKVIGNQLHVGSYKSRVIYISGDDTGNNGDWTNYDVQATPFYGSPEQITLDSEATGIGVHTGNPGIFSSNNEYTEIQYYDVTISVNVSGTLYNTLTRGTKLVKTILPNLFAAKAHEFIDSLGDDLVFLSQDNQVRVVGTFKDIFGTPRYPSLSLEVSGEMALVDFTGGHLRVAGEFIYITAPNSGTHYLHQTRQLVNENNLVQSERYWHAPQISGLSRIAVINGIVFGHSNAQPQIYQIWDTNQWHDDTPAGPVQYISVAAFAYMRAAKGKEWRRQGLTRFSKIFAEGYMTQGTYLNYMALYNYQGSTSSLLGPVNAINSAAQLFTGQGDESLGNASLGDNPLGDGLIVDLQSLLPKFVSISDVGLMDCFEFQIQFYSTNADDRWEIISFGTNAIVSPNLPVYARHS